MQGVTRTPHSSTARKTSPYVRQAYLEEFSIAARLCSLAFTNIPLINWIGSLKEPIDLNAPLSRSQRKFLEVLFYLWESLIISTRLVGGRVMVVAVPNKSTGFEDIGAVGLWIPPGKSRKLDSISIMLRSKQYRTLIGTMKDPGGWGFTALKRAAFIQQPKVEKVHKNWCSSVSLDYKRCWRVECFATHPESEGKGFCSMLIREGFEAVGKTPICLEASTSKSRAIYEHLGFKVTGEIIFGAGEVTRLGFSSKNKEENIGKLWAE